MDKMRDKVNKNITGREENMDSYYQTDYSLIYVEYVRNACSSAFKMEHCHIKFHHKKGLTIKCGTSYQ